jgi:hypothetical protein
MDCLTAVIRELEIAFLPLKQYDLKVGMVALNK